MRVGRVPGDTVRGRSETEAPEVRQSTHSADRGSAAAMFDAVMWRGLRLAHALRQRQPWAGEALRKSLLVLWWTATFQVHTQFRFWLRARKLRRTVPASVAPPNLQAAIEPADLILPRFDAPIVSVIIPTYGQVPFTLRCLASIAAHAPSVPLEVIVIDDAYPEREVAALTRVKGIRLQRNEANLGFIGSCNRAAKTARGQYLLFLNNDTQVLDGWCDAMLALFRRRDDVGAVGAKLLYPDGTLQEAGGIIWQDGSGWNFGRHEHPDKPIYNYVREVDYCSGAALMIPRSLFLRVGGFDQRYAPAYFEDSDLSFRLRSLGLKTLYQPRAQVVHFEGVSHGRDLAVGVKSYQVTNRRTFVRTWAEALDRDHYPNGTDILRARDRARHRMVVLVVDHRMPEPDRDAGSRTMISFIRALLDSDVVVKFWPQNLAYHPGYTEALQDLGVEVMYGPDQLPFRDWMRANGQALDAVLLSRPDVADDCLSVVRQFSAARVVYYGHDLHFRRMRQHGELTRDETMLRAADRMEELERGLWRRMDTVLYPSVEEAEMVLAMEPTAPARAVLPYCFDSFAEPRLAPDSRRIIFVAGFAPPPNVDAAVWFVRDVLPLIVARVPGLTMALIGSNPTARVWALAGGAIDIHANVSDAVLADWYDKARVAVVPLLSGAGVKLKVVEALRTGVPLVTTPVGAQGLAGIEDVAFVQRDAEGFADAVVALLVDDALWQQVRSAEIAYATAHFSTAALRDSLCSAMEIGAPVRETLAA